MIGRMFGLTALSVLEKRPLRSQLTRGNQAEGLSHLAFPRADNYNVPLCLFLPSHISWALDFPRIKADTLKAIDKDETLLSSENLIVIGYKSSLSNYFTRAIA
jgi:hypothetical protein